MNFLLCRFKLDWDTQGEIECICVCVWVLGKASKLRYMRVVVFGRWKTCCHICEYVSSILDGHSNENGCASAHERSYLEATLKIHRPDINLSTIRILTLRRLQYARLFFRLFCRFVGICFSFFYFGVFPISWKLHLLALNTFSVWPPCLQLTSSATRIALK